MSNIKHVKGRHAMNRVRKLFPKVKTVRDATKTITISVKSVDSRTGRRKDPESCALARACVRQRIADGAIIGIGHSWLIKGSIATRYKTSVAVGREITSFDRHQDFAAGRTYKLSKIAPTQRLGANRNGSPDRGTPRKDRPTIHHTADIRVLK